MLVEYFPAVTFLLVALFHCLFTLPFDMLDDRPSCLTNEAGPIYLSSSSSVSAPVGNCEQNKRKRANSPLIPSRDETSKLSCLLLLHIVQFSTVPSSKRQRGCNTESFNWIFTTWWVIIREKNSLFCTNVSLIEERQDNLNQTKSQVESRLQTMFLRYAGTNYLYYTKHLYELTAP